MYCIYIIISIITWGLDKYGHFNDVILNWHQVYSIGCATHIHNHTIMPHLSVVRPWVPPPNYLKFDFQENRLHDSVQTRPLCLPETNDVYYPLCLYGCIQLLQLNDF